MMPDEFDIDIPNEESQDYYEHHRIIVDKGQTSIRIDKFLTNRLNQVSRNRIQQAAEANCIIVNGKPVKSNYKVKPNDEISIVLPYPPNEYELIPENIPLDIIFEDDDLLVINKPAGLVVHPAKGNYYGTLVNGLLYHFQKLSNSESIRPGLVHRIDKDTSGLIVVAKNDFAHAHLANQFFNKTAGRTYIALVWGNFDHKEGTIIGHIGRSQKDRKKMAVYPDGSHGKHAITHYKVLMDFHYVSLIECKLETGRTHQIRAHFEYIKHPLFNDEKYGGNKIVKSSTAPKFKQFIDNCFQIMPRHALHAKSLSFIHPRTKNLLFFDSNLPVDFQILLEKWTKYSH
ncbi:MAG: RluA family pseudouridine synthase [Bacteroidales bacterium]|nr:RluA family pseudouridine synthase [Bacteroidales bacterium]